MEEEAQMPKRVDEYGAEEVQRRDSESDEDFAMDDDDPVLRELRSKRMKEMQKKEKEVIENRAKGYGEYREISQDDFLPIVTTCKRVVCHFYHSDFERCKIYDHHLRPIA